MTVQTTLFPDPSEKPPIEAALPLSPMLQKAVQAGHAQIVGEGKSRKILYVALNHTERYGDPEEVVRAEFWAELIYRYGYDPKCIGVEITVPDRTPSDRADLVVFRDASRKSPFAVIECKRDLITDAEFRQAVEQACGNGAAHRFRADYVMVVAGSTRRVLDVTDKFPALERERNIVADLPERYGKPAEYKYYKGEASDIKPVVKEALIAAIKKCHQTLWGGGRFSPPTAFGELCKIIFVKISDEQAPRKKGEPYEFQIKTGETSRRLAERIHALYEVHSRSNERVFEEKIKIDDGTLRTVVNHLESINLNKTDLDTKGLAFEQFMDGFFKGDFGQYFTPREIIAFAVEMMQPRASELVLDPSCGSGGFLLYALDAVRREAEDFHPDHATDVSEGQAYYKHWHDFAEKRLFGIEINEEIARVSKMNMILHDDGHTNVIGADALEAVELIAAQNKGFGADAFDLVLTNPPFGAMVKQDEKPYLSDYEMSRIANPVKAGAMSDPKAGKKMIKQKTSVKTEILFCERIHTFLKPGVGRAAIVLPDGILTNSSLQGVRNWLLNSFQLLAVVSLPQTAFAHFGAGVKSSLVFVRKRAPGEVPDDDEAIFMAQAENIGYDATGRKSFKVVSADMNGDTKTEIHRCDLLDLRVTYENRPDPDTGELRWMEKHTAVVSDSGLIAEYRRFLHNPAPFFA